MRALGIIIILLAILGLATVGVIFWEIINEVIDRIKGLIRKLKRRCPKCYTRVGEKDLYCKHCGHALFEEEE